MRFLLLCSLLYALCISSGCKTPVQPDPDPVKPKPFDVSIKPKPLMTSSTSFRGNEYDIIAYVTTNRPDYPDFDVYDPIPRRVHIQLSLDGGTNYSRTVAYGVPVITNTVHYVWSLPWTDSSLLTEQARIRVTDLEYEDISTVNGNFTIAGLFLASPEAGATLIRGTTIELAWLQAGVGAAAELGYITPDVEFTVLITFSNLVVGANHTDWLVAGVPEAPALRLVLRSVSDPKVWGVTGNLEVQ